MIKPSLYHYSDVYIFVKGTITVPNTAAQGAAANNTNKNVIFKNCALPTSCITKTNNTQVEEAQDIDIVILILIQYNVIEYSNAYPKTSGSLWQYYRDDNISNIIDFFDGNNNSTPFKFKQQITGQTGNGGTENVEIMVPLKYQSNFWRTLEMSLINYEISLQLMFFIKRILPAGTAANQVSKKLE